jgi:hypothetical protein
MFKWRGAEAPEPREDIVAAYQTLVDRLLEAGWMVEGDKRTWFEESFTRRGGA